MSWSLVVVSWFDHSLSPCHVSLSCPLTPALSVSLCPPLSFSPHCISLRAHFSLPPFHHTITTVNDIQPSMLLPLSWSLSLSLIYLCPFAYYLSLTSCPPPPPGAPPPAVRKALKDGGRSRGKQVTVFCFLHCNL